jgi:hypothetical protein
MKGKFSSIWRVVIAVVLAASLGLVIAVPVAANVSAATVTPMPNTASAPAEYTITFTTNEDLAITADDDVRIRFPDDTGVPGSYTNNSISINGIDVNNTVGDVDVDITDRTFIIDVPEDVPHGTVTVVFKLAAGITNPSTTGFYTLDVSTSREVTWVESQEYEIVAGPVILYLKHVAECGYIEYEFVATFDNIQDALDEADDLFMTGDFYGYGYMPDYCNYVGAKVVVQPGTYEETLVIDTPVVDVVAPNGATIDAEGLEPASYPAAVAITAGGVTFEGFTVMNAGVGVDADSWMDFDDDGIADIKGILVVMDSEKNSAPIYIDEMGQPFPDTYAYNARVNILDNEVCDGVSIGIAVFGDPNPYGACVLVSGNNVHDNQWDGFWGSGLRNGLEVIDPTAFTPNPNQPYACTEINDNTFADNGQGWNELDGYSMASSDNGIQIMSADFEDWLNYGVIDKTIYIVGNEIYRNSNAGIYLGHDVDDSVIIKFNQIEDNDVFGISSHHNWPIIVSCIYNDIAGNGVWGIKNWEAMDDYPDADFDDNIIAPFNYWGDLSGPSCGPEPIDHEVDQRSDALGSGDAVSHYVFYKWWLTSSFKDVREDLIRYYGSDCYSPGPDLVVQTTPIVPLVQGWNTMSTPVALDERADQMGEIVALGGWMQNYILGYSYDPASGWVLIDADFQLKPLEAVYVKMAGPDLLPILLRTTNYMPARDLEPGWNLVSLNAGFWSQSIWDMPVDEALASISGSWGNAISPDMPGQQDSWVCTPSTAPDYYMSVGDGYWVFITKATTLAGFRMAPWYLQDWEMDIMNCQLPPWWDYVPLPPWWGP